MHLVDGTSWYEGQTQLGDCAYVLVDTFIYYQQFYGNVVFDPDWWAVSRWQRQANVFLKSLDGDPVPVEARQ